MVGPGEKANEPFGSLGFVAPEVLKGDPYDKAIDIFSLGVMLYVMMSASMPFDDDDQSEMANKVMHDPVEFNDPCWNSRSKDVKDLICKMLHKSGEKRISINGLLKHPWFND